MFAKEFHFTPHQVDEMLAEDVDMLMMVSSMFNEKRRLDMEMEKARNKR